MLVSTCLRKVIFWWNVETTYSEVFTIYFTIFLQNKLLVFMTLRIKFWPGKVGCWMESICMQAQHINLIPVIIKNEKKVSKSWILYHVYNQKQDEVQKTFTNKSGRTYTAKRKFVSAANACHCPNQISCTLVMSIPLE